MGWAGIGAENRAREDHYSWASHAKRVKAGFRPQKKWTVDFLALTRQCISTFYQPSPIRAPSQS